MLIARLATAVVVAPVVVVTVWLGGPILWGVAALFAGVAAFEAERLLRRPGPPDVTGEVIDAPAGGHPPTARLNLAGAGDLSWVALTVVAAGLLPLAAALGASSLVSALATIVVLSTGLLLVRRAAGDQALDRWSICLAASLYAGLPLSLLITMRGWSGFTDLSLPYLGPLSEGAGWVLLTLTTVWAADTAAYAVGRGFGRRLLWPRLSPKKTWEGTLAGVVAGMVVSEAWGPVLHLDAGFALGLGLAGSIAAVLGDLFESALKRSARVKDSGSLFPGHGGLLDRIDSLALATVVVFLSGILGGAAGHP